MQRGRFLPRKAILSSFRASCLRRSERIDDAALAAVANTVGQKSLRDIMIYSKGEVTLDNLLSILSKWLEPSNFQYRHMEDGALNLIIRHNYGPKWSAFLQALISPFLNQLGYRKTHAILEQDLFAYTVVKL
jgi:hypothetical protein